METAYKLAYQKAVEHAQTNTRCAHLASSLLIDGQVTHIACNNKSTHAELAALQCFFFSLFLAAGSWFSLVLTWIVRRILFRRVLDIIIVRVKKDGSTGMAKPCVDCLVVIKAINIRFVYYTNADGVLVKERAVEMSSNHKCKAKPPKKRK